MSTFSDISANFEFLDDWEDRYRYLIELGQALPEMPEHLKSESNKVSGCVSQVWVSSHADDTGASGEKVIAFQADSDAMIVKGIVALLLALYSGQTAKFVRDTDAIDVLDNMGLREHLTAQRSNGLVSMVKRMRQDAAELLR